MTIFYAKAPRAIDELNEIDICEREVLLAKQALILAEAHKESMDNPTVGVIAAYRGAKSKYMHAKRRLKLAKNAHKRGRKKRKTLRNKHSKNISGHNSNWNWKPNK